MRPGLFRGTKHVLARVEERPARVRAVSRTLPHINRRGTCKLFSARLHDARLSL